jgi:8-oxo-dGTP diphosphatase
MGHDDWADAYLSHTYPDDDPYEGDRGVDIVVFAPDVDALLLVRRSKNPFRSFLVPPSGGVKTGESFAHAACRELLEETGLEIDESRLQVICDYRYDDYDPRGPVWARRYLVMVEGCPEVVAGDDAASAHWVRVDDIAFGSLGMEHATGLRDGLLLAGRLPIEPPMA